MWHSAATSKAQSACSKHARDIVCVGRVVHLQQRQHASKLRMSKKRKRTCSSTSLPSIEVLLATTLSVTS